eukprot:PhF_6_TR11336/c0_g1_i2/m.18311
MIGSTPHRRWGLQYIPSSTEDTPIALPTQDDMQKSIESFSSPSSLSKQEKAQLQNLWDISSDETYEDEMLLLQLHNVCARASVQAKEYDTAIDFLHRSLPFAHDDQRTAKVHNDISTCMLLKGKFSEATTHAQRSVMLADDPKGYALWALARGYENAMDDALMIASRGKESHPANPHVSKALRTLQESAVGRVDTAEKLKSARWQSKHQVDVAVNTSPFRYVDSKRMDPATSYW